MIVVGSASGKGAFRAQSSNRHDESILTVDFGTSGLLLDIGSLDCIVLVVEVLNQ
jgi:hypothetical protein